ncbi:hypothetical protein GWI33_008963, partial [Rhynchophorus ferrugineus]
MNTCDQINGSELQKPLPPWSLEKGTSPFYVHVQPTSVQFGVDTEINSR